MQKVDFNNPGEKKKLIVAIGLGVAALLFLWWALFGFGSSSSPTRRTATTTPAARETPARTTPGSAVELKSGLDVQLQPVVFQRSRPPFVEAGRNIFTFYEPPPRPEKVVVTPTPTPTPPPPVLLASISPSNVFAKTGDFTLEVSGDKFTGDLRIVIDGREMTTRFIGPQQMSASVPASLIATPGVRQVSLRSPDGRLYSNSFSLNVAQPPSPNYTYIGIIGTRRYVDVAILQNRTNRDVINVQRGDLLDGRYRVTSISEKEVVLVDSNLKIRHPLPLTAEPERGFNPMQRPTPRVESEDDEPLE